MLTKDDNAATLASMAIKSHEKMGDQKLVTVDGDALFLGLTEPTGGQIMIGVGREGVVFAVNSDAKRAREVAESLNKFADVLEGK